LRSSPTAPTASACVRSWPARRRRIGDQSREMRPW
jgi:hypothetical protein